MSEQDLAALVPRIEAALAGQDERLVLTARALAKLYCLAAVEDALARVRVLEADLQAQRKRWKAELSDGQDMFRALTSETFQKSLKAAS